jgi:hypothetical protein
MVIRLTVVFCFLAAVLSADPIVLFSDFGANNAYAVGPGITIGCGAVCWDNAGYSDAWAFTPSVTASLSTVETEAWSIVSSPPTTDLLVSIMSDASGLPGSVLETFDLSITPAESLVIGYSSANPVLFAGTQYWFAVSVPDLINNAAQVGIDSTGYLGPWANRVGEGPWEPTSGSADAVFSITGSTAVPEPASGWLAAAAVMGIVGTLRLKKLIYVTANNSDPNSCIAPLRRGALR